MKTDTNHTVGSDCPEANYSALRDVMRVNAAAKRESDMRTRLLRTRDELTRHLREIEDAVRVEPTSWLVLLRSTAEGTWEALTCVDANNLPDEGEMPEEWNLALPIPKPETVPEFQGW